MQILKKPKKPFKKKAWCFVKLLLLISVLDEQSLNKGILSMASITPSSKDIFPLEIASYTGCTWKMFEI